MRGVRSLSCVQSSAFLHFTPSLLPVPGELLPVPRSEPLASLGRRRWSRRARASDPGTRGDPSGSAGVCGCGWKFTVRSLVRRRLGHRNEASGKPVGTRRSKAKCRLLGLLGGDLPLRLPVHRPPPARFAPSHPRPPTVGVSGASRGSAAPSMLAGELKTGCPLSCRLWDLHAYGFFAFSFRCLLCVVGI